MTLSFPHPRSLQHPNVLQCLGVCVETLPFLLIMEFCQLVRPNWRQEGRGGQEVGCGPQTGSLVFPGDGHPGKLRLW